ncbi:MAG TPA: serine/threonine-protein kinase PknK, partial [Noviherbaspirillum sp.]
MNIPGYRVQELLYESRRSRVYRGTRVQDGLPVVLKVLHSNLPEQRARFRQEYKLTRKLQSAGVGAAYAFESPPGALVMVLEDFGGASLNTLGVAGKLSLSDWLTLAIRITEALVQLHRQHIIHKDINPSNIVWNRQSGEVKLIDLGISTELSRELPEVHHPGRLEGSLPYLSPEQTGRINRAMDYRADFYSLGVTFYELLLGQLPFPGNDPLEIVHAHIAKSAPSPTKLNPRIPQILSDIVGKLLAKTPEERYQSALGLQRDLQTCQHTLTDDGVIPAFVLGTHDFPDRLQVSQKLYGRGSQIAMLKAAFERCSRGPAELLLVAGYSGIGKSALVREIQQSITQYRGCFIEGKFDQFKRDIPYAALTQAFSELVRHILTEEEAAVAAWKSRLLETLGPNAQVIVDVIPNLELVIGPQPPVPTLLPGLAQNRFNYEFRKFVSTIASMDHPLVIFLDDLQWADLPSLQLMLQLLRAPATSHLLVIGAYRDNEVTAGHALPLMLREMEQHGAKIQTITLAPLDLSDVAQLLSDTLHAGREKVQELAQLCVTKTHGNPFFLNQFLGVLAEQHMLCWDVVQSSWQWDIASIQQAGITDNIVELLVAKLQKLPVATQRVLQGAACLGNAFDLKMLAAACALSEAETASLLWQALLEGMIVPLDERYKYAEHSQDSGEAVLAPAYRFLHDRVQQAAYLLSDEAERTSMHLAIARIWLSTLSPGQQHEMLFDLVNHLNHGRAMIADPAERLRLAKLNLAAAQRAKVSAAYKPALMYLQTGLEAVSDRDWQQEYELMFALHLEAAEMAYVGINFALMDCYVKAALPHVTDLLDQVKLHDVRIQAFIAENKFHDALSTGLQLLESLGVSFAKHPTRAHIVLSVIQTKYVLDGKSADDLAGLPVMTDPRAQAALRLLMAISSPAYYAMPMYMPLIILKAVRLSLKYGNGPVSPYFYAGYGMLLGSVIGDIARARQYSDLALHLLEREGMGGTKCRTWLVVHALTRPYTAPLQQTLEPLTLNYLHAVQTGELEFSGLAAMLYSFYAFYSGRELGELEKEIADYCAVIGKLEDSAPFNCSRVLRQAVHNLMGLAPDPRTLHGNVCNEQDMRTLHAQTEDQLLMFYLHSSELIIHYLFRNYREALESATRVARYVETLVGSFGVAMVCFYESLVLLEAQDSVSPGERRAMRRQIRHNQKRLRHWADHTPSSFLHKWYLVEAGRARRSGQHLKAIDAYENAIRLAGENSFLQEEALAKELAGEFYLERGQESVATHYLRQARDDYECWGALAKARDLTDRYPQWLQEQESPKNFSRAIARPTLSMDDASIAGTRISNGGTLDLATVMKASQALSEEIVLEKLLKRLMQIVMENAGAQRGVL